MSFTPDKYQKRCLETWFGDERPFTEHLQHMANGLTSEAGEFMSLVDKQIYKPNKNITRAQMLDEVGDVAYNLAIGAALFQITIDELFGMNAEKLKDGHGWIDFDFGSQRGEVPIENEPCEYCGGEGGYQFSENPDDCEICSFCKGTENLSSIEDME